MNAPKGESKRLSPNKNRMTYTLTALAAQTDYDFVTDIGVPANNATITFDQNATIYIYDGEAWDGGHTHYAGIQTIIKDEEMHKLRVTPGAVGNGSIKVSGW